MRTPLLSNIILHKTTFEPVPITKSPTTTNLKLLAIQQEKQKLNDKMQKLSFAEELIERESSYNTALSSPKTTIKRSRSKEGNYQEEDKKKQIEAHFLVQKLNVEKKEREKEAMRRQQELEEMTKSELENDAKKVKEALEEKISKIKEETMQKHMLAKEQRQKDFEEFRNNKRKMIPESERMYKKLEGKYEKEVMLPMLEYKKQQLAKKRGEYRKIPLEEILDHERKHTSLMKEHSERREEEHEKQLEEEREIRKHQRELKTNVLEQIQKHYAEIRKQHNENEERKKNVRRKMLQYSEMVKETTPIMVNETKAAEVKKRIELLKHQPRELADPKEIKEKYAISNIEAFKTLSKASKMISNKSPATEGGTNKSFEALTPCDSKNMKGLCKKCVAAKSGYIRHKPDYLSELRKKREDIGVVPYKSNWESDFNDSKLAIEERNNKILEKAERMEERAKRNEKLLEAKGGLAKSYDMGEHVSGMLLDAMKAKLAVLENL